MPTLLLLALVCFSNGVGRAAEVATPGDLPTTRENSNAFVQTRRKYKLPHPSGARFDAADQDVGEM